MSSSDAQGAVPNDSQPYVRASWRDCVAVVRDVLLPLVAVGPIIRRPWASRWAERRQVDKRLIATLHRLRLRYGGRTVLLRLGPRRLLLPLAADDAKRVLGCSPEPFSPATVEKRAALRHFQPGAVLISAPSVRPARRVWNERALDDGRPVHRDAHSLLQAPMRIGKLLGDRAAEQGGLSWAEVDGPFAAMVREVVLGPEARADSALTADLDHLRRAGNLAYLRPRDARRLASFRRRLVRHLEDPAPGSLAAAGGKDLDEAMRQVPHWLFAFDAARLVTWRTLGMLAARPGWQERVREEAARKSVTRGAPDEPPAELPIARACLLETARLWPTTLVVLRQTTRQTRWGSALLPAATEVALMSAYLHRDPSRAGADSFDPGDWLTDGATAASPRGDAAIIPFSAGPAACPGRDVVLLTAGHLLAAMVGSARWEPRSHDLLATDPVPATFDHFGLTLGAGPSPFDGDGGDGQLDVYEDWTVDELYRRAAERGIRGRSSMRKSDLIKALRES